MKIKIKNLNSYFVVAFFVMLENLFYLINTDTFSILGVLNYAMLWFWIFVIYYVYKFFTTKSPKIRSLFSTDVLALILLTIISSYTAYKYVGQPMFHGFMPQRNYIFILLSYFALRKIFLDDNNIDLEKTKNMILFVGVLSILLYSIQIILFNKIEFIHAYTNGIQIRLYVDSFLCVVVAFIGMNMYLKYNKKKYLFFVVMTFIYEIFVAKGRLEFAALAISLIIGLLLRKGSATKKIITIITVSIAVVAFLNSNYAEKFYYAISVFNSKDNSVNTMGVRLGARDLFFEQLTENSTTLLFGCGYPNTAYYGSARKIRKDLNYGLVDNGIFAYVYVYGIFGLAIFIKWFYKLYKYAWQIYKNYGDYIYIMFMIFLTILLYNITFWWHKPSWTFAMVVLMCLEEKKIKEWKEDKKNERENKKSFDSIK